MKTLSLFCAITFLFTLSGCGQDGPLFLPPPAKAQATQQTPKKTEDRHAHQNTRNL